MSAERSRRRTQLIAAAGAVVAAAAGGTWWLLSSGASAEEWDRSLTYSETTTAPLDGPSRIQISYLSVDESSANIPNYGDRAYTPHIALTAFNDSDKTRDYTVVFRVLLAGKIVKPHNNTVKIQGVEPDTKGLGRYEISRKEWDPDLMDDETGETGAESETYIDSPTGKDFTLEIVSVKAEKHYAVSGQ
ncbi:hypothetical protein AB0I10_12095 [Streptomyces sp. NPDC050636]|uniref:hypothetical protein n=1 Tax=Streptomyces sp. NPDC050636 TaxID=3154510 RepID=UPI0034476AFE